MEHRTWGKWFFYMAAWSLPSFSSISYVAWNGKVVWLHICSLATVEAHTRAQESGFPNTLMWNAGFMQNSVRWLYLSPGKHSPLAFIANPSLLAGVLPVYAADWVCTGLYTSVAAFASITHSWSSIDAPCWDQRKRSISQLFTTSTSPQFDSIPFRSDFTDPTGTYFSNEIHGTLVQKHNQIIQNRRGNLILQTSPHTNEFLFFRRQQVTILITDKNNGNTDVSKTNHTTVLVLKKLSDGKRVRVRG